MLIANAVVVTLLVAASVLGSCVGVVVELRAGMVVGIVVEMIVLVGSDSGIGYSWVIVGNVEVVDEILDLGSVRGTW